MQFFSHASNARRAARKALGKDAKEGEHYQLTRNTWGKVAFHPIKKRRPAKAPLAPLHIRRAEAARRAKARPMPPAEAAKLRDAAAARAASTWQNQLFELLNRPKGATAREVAQAFNWQEHTARARISTALREMGIQVERRREERGGEKVSVYRPLPQLQLGEKREALGNVYRKEESV